MKMLEGSGRVVLRVPGVSRVLMWWLTCCWLSAPIRAQTLTPPYFNLAEGRKITASATCGVDTEGPELYCKLVGANAENDINVNLIQGQLCDYCDPTNPQKMHPPEFAVDGMETWWQSPPLSRGMKYNEVNLTIDLGQEFHVAYVYIRMGNSPRPGLWILEKSSDYGKTFVPWQYFSDSEADCEAHFGKESLQPITKDDSVICTTDFSKIVPLESGEIPISLLNNRPSANHYFNSSVLQDWTRSTNVRFRFLRTKNFLGHLMSVARQDPTVTRRYFYSIKDISIGGRCMCNGHADTCDIQDPHDPNVLLCRCQHNTCGPKCEMCCPGYEQKAWRISKSYEIFSCERCNCFQHSNECEYDPEIDRQHLSLDMHGRYEGGGVCRNCQHNTEGINCNRCKPTFYKPFNKSWNETDVCHPCDCNHFYSTGNCEEGTGKCECRKEFTPPNCDTCSFGHYDYPKCKPCDCFLNGTQSLQCEPRGGKCSCKYNFGGDLCRECAPEFYNFPKCQPCECNPLGSLTTTCNQVTGNCTCKNNYGGKQCDQCQDGFYNYPSCIYCNCDNKGTRDGICDKNNGKCLCKEGYGGERCDQCVPGYYGYPDCKPCNCSTIGSSQQVCDTNGKCPCLTNFGGLSCEQCSVGYFKYPECLPCNCDGHGSIGISCDGEGRCSCHHNFDGNRCHRCKEGFYNFPNCEECNCNPAGVVAAFAGCGSVPAGELCRCKERVQGRICDKCKPLYWNLHLNNPEGCDECRCHIPGVLGGIAVCDSESGQCVCKPSVVSRTCSDCADGTYNLVEDDLFGCRDCGCDIGGSINSICDKLSGQCPCQSRVTGRTCKEPLQAHYFPTLYQYQYEVEDGRTLANTAVRYAYNESIFPRYSWKGYAVFSQLQNEILQDLFIQKPSLYRMVLRYINFNPETVTGTIKITPESSTDIEQTYQVQFKNSSTPTFVTVSGATGNVPTALVMYPGRWTVSIQSKKNLLVDYFVLLPEDFYSASILNQKVEEPCTIGSDGLCREYAYPNISQYDMSLGVGGYISVRNDIDSLRDMYENRDHLNQLNVANRVPLLNHDQPEISYNLTVARPGRYVVIVNYVTPIDDLRTHIVPVDVTTQSDQSRGTVTLYACPYTTVCRQAITDKQSGIGVHLVDSNTISVKFYGSNANVGIHSVAAIPYEEWSLDFIKPKQVCIRKKGNCLASTFPNPPESKKIRFEQEIDLDSPEVNRIYKTNSSIYVKLNDIDNVMDLHAKVPTPGYYVFIVQYYQPDYPEFKVEVIVQNGQFYEAELRVPHCPSQSGCRHIVTQLDGTRHFSLTENFMITLKSGNNKGVYLDYLLIVPIDLYSDRILDEDTLDRTGEFVSMCGYNNFQIDTTENGFCRDSVFSITAAHNNGALPCQCDYDGSLSFECDKFGGQCQCKPNIIGRKCEACRTGFYGFPDCKPCKCPITAICEASTGRCICPPHVTGELCDQCMPYTYGFDSIIGCEQCNCNPLGVFSSLQCDLLNGSCACKKNIVGRTCDVCKPGHFAFPYCESCECDLRGTVEDICDQNSAECFCKKHVTGPQCNMCREGSFNLQESNEGGCTECFCFGKTTRCTSSNFVQVLVTSMDDWKLTSVNESIKLNISTLTLNVDKIDQHTIGADFSSDYALNKSVYFSAPQPYLGRKLTAYGGYFNYTIFYTIGNSGKAASGADIIIEGAGIHLLHTSIEQPAPAEDFVFSIQFVEANFQLSNGLPARREDVMTVLDNLQGIYMRATYWSASVTTRLSNVLLEDSVASTQQQFHQGRFARNASSVEMCQCPPGYQGLSCEDCAPGYYRISSGPHGGYCVPCQCNGHADECDVHTGVCLNCQHSTRGDHCDQCAVGYHGNALQGTPMDCLICACPLPIASNNFATSCEVSADGEKIRCDCVEGYFGERCHSCASGYYGKPEIAGEYCKPCQCSGNIDPNELGSCDTVSGECLRCLNNTYGSACALCAPGYYGDAIKAKDCQVCDCDQLGTQHCNSYNGTCECKTNIVGEKCDRCDVEHYGFQSGQGCNRCDCAEAAYSDQCDDLTGQCRCKEGVAGRTCDHCAPGYWNYTFEGCVSCGCKTEYSLGFGCNAQTGKCECLPGVTGEKCDQCQYRWAFVPDVGCHECNSCVHNLLDDTDHLKGLIDPIIFEFDSADSGFFTTRRLAHINDTLNELKPKVELLDPSKIDVSSILEEVNGLEQDSKNMNRRAEYAIDNNEKLSEEADNIGAEALLVLEDIRQATLEAQGAIENVELLSETLIAGEGPKSDMAVAEAEKVLNQIKLYNLTGRDDESVKQLLKATTLLENLYDFKEPVNVEGQQMRKLKDDLRKFIGKIEDLSNHTQYTLNKANEAENLLQKSSKDNVERKLRNIENQTQEAEQNLKHTKQLLKNATQYLRDAGTLLLNIGEDPQSLERDNNLLNETLEYNFRGLAAVEEQLPEVQQHAVNLTQRAQELDNLLTETRNTSTNAVRAATAYKEIVNAIEQAHEAAEAGKEAADDAAELLTEVAEKTFASEDRSKNLLSDAFDAYQTTSDNLKPRLQEVDVKSRPVRSLHTKNDDRLNAINKFLDHPHMKPLDKSLINATKTAETSHILAETTLDRVAEGYKEVAREKNESRHLPKNLADTQRNILQTKEQINTVNADLPKILNTLDNLPQRQNELRKIAETLEDKIRILTQQIALARDVANRIKVGVKFYPNTTLELRNPPNLDDLSTSTYMSGYFATNDTSGLVLYLGNGENTNLRRTNTDDYMALEIVNGYPVLTIDVGDGPQRIISNKYVSDNTWYQFIIDRTAHNAKLTIREEVAGGQEKLHVVEEDLPGHHSIFNLDKTLSKLFVGGYPPQFPMQQQIQENSFNGEIEELVIGDRPISLWNFNDGNDNNHGAIRRDRLVNLHPSTGYRFNGNGYTIIDARSYSLRSRSDIQLSFNTFASEGLLFLVGKDKTFISLELRNGKILYQYNLGTGTKVWYTPNTYNDGRWHTVSASREGAKGRFIVDNEEIFEKTKPITGNIVEPSETFFFGGYPQQHNFRDVTNTDFDGCIDNITIMGNPVDLSQNVKAYGVTAGCPQKFARLISFSDTRAGFIKCDNFSSSDTLKMNLRFKTKSKEGLLFYLSDKFQNEGISLSLVDGHLKLITQKIELETDDNPFDDNEWHVVTITHNSSLLRLDYDDYGYKVTDSPPPPVRILYGDMYVGGLPAGFNIKKGMVGTTKAFAGCLVDASRNGNVINFANYTVKMGEILGKCVLDETEGNQTKVHVVPTLPPIDEVPYVTTKAAEISTEDPVLAGIPKRGDGGQDTGPSDTREQELQQTTQPATTPPQLTTTTPPTPPPHRQPPTTPKPPSEPSCALPMISSSNIQLTLAFRYGTANESRSEYNTARGKYRKQFDFALEFRTASKEGILFYASDPHHSQYVALYMQDGHILYTFSAGSDHTPAVMRSTKTYADDAWHQINISRTGPEGSLMIDGEFVADGRTGGNTMKIDLYTPYYVGGIRPDHAADILYNLQTTTSFAGCIANFTMNGKPMENPTNIGVVSCSNDIETGAFFGVHGGYMRLKDRFRVGLEIDIKLDIKPRNISGLLISVHGKRDYLVLEMVNGVIKLTVENGKGAISTAFQPDKTHYFCDGQWHNIQAVKSKNVVTLSVDRTYTDPGVGDYRSQSTDTGGALFLGGHRLITKVRGISVRSPYTGCIKNVLINNQMLNLLPDMAAGDVNVEGCPAN